jgi:SP family arabinose:H+ symporter-like MFS transporter
MQQTGKTSLFAVAVAASAATAGLLFGYDVAVFNGALVFLRAEFHLGSVPTEILTTMLFVGCAAGAAIGGWASDRYGRRVVLFIAGVLFCAAALSATFSMHLWHLMAASMFAGMAVGAAVLIAPMYIAEIAPAHKRGMLVTLNQLAIVSGILVGFVVNYELAVLVHGNWRLMFFLGALPAVVLCVSMVRIPESPRWLLQQGQRERASVVLQKISPGTDVESTIDEIGKAIREESGTYRELLGRALRKPLMLAVMLAIIQQVTGVNTVMYYGAIIFAEHAGASATQAIGMNVIVGVVNVVATILGLLLIDKLGRRPLLLTATGGMALSLVAFASMLTYMSNHAALLLTAVLGYVAFYAFGLGTGVWVCLSELFPNRIRGRAMSIANMVLWATLSCVTATFLSLIKMFTASGVFLGYALLCTASFVYILARLPETKNRTLEEIESSWLRKDAIDAPVV